MNIIYIIYIYIYIYEYNIYLYYIHIYIYIYIYIYICMYISYSYIYMVLWVLFMGSVFLWVQFSLGHPVCIHPRLLNGCCMPLFIHILLPHLPQFICFLTSIYTVTFGGTSSLGYSSRSNRMTLFSSEINICYFTFKTR